VVVPTYNEAENLPRLIAQIERALHARSFCIIVVDDSSPDNTAEVAERLNDSYGNIVVRTREGKDGLGSALLDGLKTALNMEDVESIVTLDGDLSHNPKEIPKLLSVAETTELVQGSRYVKRGAVLGWSLKRRLISFVANSLCKLVLRTHIHDCTGNFRIYSRRCAEMIVNSTDSGGFEWVVEAMLVAVKRGFRVKEVPITFTDRKNGRTKLKIREVAGWGLFALKNLLAPKPTFLDAGYQPTWVIHRSSILTTAVTLPIASTTMYTLSRVSPTVSDHAESTRLVKSSE
jgi:dolichol-phosphate mannosyltransferase